MILKLNEEQQELKLIQVNDGFIIINNKRPEHREYYYIPFTDNIERYDENIDYGQFHPHLFKWKKVVFATLNLNLEGVSTIEENGEWLNIAIREEEKEILSNNHYQPTSWYNGVKLGYRQAQQKLFTIDDMRLAMEQGYSHCTDSYEDYQERFDTLIKYLKQPKVEITFEENQCDGCKAGYPIENGIHKVNYPSGSMACQKGKYNKPIKCVLL